MLAWFLLILAGILEAFWPIALKATDGFSKPVPNAIASLLIAASIIAMGFAMRSIPASTAYIMFIGMGAIGVPITAYFFYGEALTLIKCAFILLILFGIIGLKLT